MGANKVKSSFKKRFKLKANGRIAVRAANRNHILTKKSSKRKMRLRTPGSSVSIADRAIVLRVMGWLGKRSRRQVRSD
jgi:large subunit ribosomal protein L35